MNCIRRNDLSNDYISTSKVIRGWLREMKIFFELAARFCASSPRCWSAGRVYDGNKVYRAYIGE